ncbi:P-loop containing nucleoside triphosphate hydrolase protein [Amylocystis lapponica]|nr:P-loop containing nucleoside triphosphate hydrolase protein [Amylocystis lapponica]
MSQRHTARGDLADLEDAFIKVTFEEDAAGGEPVQANDLHDPAHGPWLEQASSPYSDVALYGVKTFKKLYPKHSLVMSVDYTINILSFPGLVKEPLAPSELVSSLVFIPFARKLGSVPGVLVDQIKFGSFHLKWNNHDFILYIARYPSGFGEQIQHYILHEGPESNSRALLIAAGAWHNQLHDEVYVFNSGYWAKDHNLWVEIQKANWDDVILKDSFKSALKKDVYGFFSSEELYKNLSIPWKRGLIMFGPPGNGKTISLKAIMKDCDAFGYAPLYVRSFKSWMGDEGSMAAVFSKAREMAPCVIVLEDLDSLINDQNRSFFLNQLDGLEGNDGLLVIGSTNHFDKLDPALSGRPSRFDRKYAFEDPDLEERALYAKFWQDKLQSSKGISFPDNLVTDIAAATEKFSFAYLKEAFVSTLVLLAGFEPDDKPTFGTVVMGQIKELRSQLDKDPGRALPVPPRAFDIAPAQAAIARPKTRMQPLDTRLLCQDRIWDAGEGTRMSMPGELPGIGRQRPETRSTRTVMGRSGGLSYTEDVALWCEEYLYCFILV